MPEVDLAGKCLAAHQWGHRTSAFLSKNRPHTNARRRELVCFLRRRSTRNVARLETRPEAKNRRPSCKQMRQILQLRLRLENCRCHYQAIRSNSQCRPARPPRTLSCQNRPRPRRPRHLMRSAVNRTSIALEAASTIAAHLTLRRKREEGRHSSERRHVLRHRRRWTSYTFLRDRLAPTTWRHLSRRGHRVLFHSWLGSQP